MLLDGGSGVNIIIEQLRLRLGLPKLKPTPCNLRMVNQTTTKPVGLIRDMKICSWHSLHNYVYCTLRMLNWHMIGGVTLLPYKGMG